MRTRSLLRATSLSTVLALGACHSSVAPNNPASSPSGPIDLLDAVPQNTALIVSLDTKTFFTSKLWQTFRPMIVKQEAAEAVAFAKDTCGIDLETDVQSILITMPDSGEEDDGLFFVRGNFDAAKLTDCATKLAAKEGKTITSKVDGKLTAVTDGDDTIYYGWVDPHTLVVSAHAAQGDPSGLLTALAATSSIKANAPMMELIGKVDRTKMAWGVFVKPTSGPLAEENDMPLAVWGDGHHITDLTGMINAKMPSADAASGAVAAFEGAKGQVPFSLDGLSVTAEGDLLKVTLNFTEAQVDDLLKQLGGMLGMGAD
jgi:hypothetical protein